MVYETSQIFSQSIIDDIHAKAGLGRYRIRGFSTFQKVTHFDDLTFLSTGLTRFPLEGYKERCDTRTVIGARHAEDPLVLETPVYVSGMSYGALSKPAPRLPWARPPPWSGTATCTGDGGMLQAKSGRRRRSLYTRYCPVATESNPQPRPARQHAIEIVRRAGSETWHRRAC